MFTFHNNQDDSFDVCFCWTRFSNIELKTKKTFFSMRNATDLDQ